MDRPRPTGDLREDLRLWREQLSPVYDLLLKEDSENAKAHNMLVARIDVHALFGVGADGVPHRALATRNLRPQYRHCYDIGRVVRHVL